MEKYTTIDNDFGGGTESALKAAGLPTIVDEATFNRVVGGSGGSTTNSNPQQLATQLRKAANSADLNGVLAVLKQLKSVSDYQAVNEKYKETTLISETIVTGLLDYSFSSNYVAKDQIKKEFLRIGLKQDQATGKWSLSGLDGFSDIMTTRSTMVGNGAMLIAVKPNTVLGEEISRTNGIITFRSLDKSLWTVAAIDIRYS